MIYKIYHSFINKINDSYLFIKDIYELPENIKQLIKEHHYYKKEYYKLLRFLEEICQRSGFLFRIPKKIF
jgi:hypothetical protein